MKKALFPLVLFLLFVFSSCSLTASVAPEHTDTTRAFYENRELFLRCAEAVATLRENVLISRSDLYAPEGLGDRSGMYIENMESRTFSSFENRDVALLFSEAGIVTLDAVWHEDLCVIAFSLTKPGKNADYGYYYTSGEKPVYLGDPAAELDELNGSYRYEVKTSLGSGFTFYTEPMSDHFYYYEIL